MHSKLFFNMLSIAVLLCDYSALEPVISCEIMELHHKKHHQAYVTGYNTAYKQFKEVRCLVLCARDLAGT